MATGRDANRVLDLLPPQMHGADRDDGRDILGQSSVVPDAFANSGKRRLTEAHLELVRENKSHDQLFAITFRPLATGQGGRENIRRMRRVLLPVNVVVVHAAD